MLLYDLLESGFDQEAGIGIDGQDFKFKVRDLVALAKNYPIAKIDPKQFEEQLAGRDEDPEQSMARAQKAELKYPIIVVKRKNGDLWIADGTHRVHKAIMMNLPTIAAKIIPVEDMGRFLINEGPRWEKFKNAATAGIAAGALGYGAMTGQFTGKSNHQQPQPQTQQTVKSPTEIDITPGSAQQAPTQKLSPSTVTQANAEMENLVLTIAMKAGLRSKELAQFMAQAAHETHGFNKMSEVGSKEYFKKYDPTVNPKKAAILGNTQAGDGIKYRGRGFIQLTGRDNYKRAGKALGLPLEEKPQLATHPEVAAKIAVWYWKTRVRTEVTDFTDTIGVTAKINPNMNGLGDRDKNFQHYLQQFDSIINENFADGKNPGRKGLAKRSGVNCKQSVTKLRQVAKNSSGEKQRMAHWCANMKSGKKK